MSNYKPEKIIDSHIHVFPDELAPKAVETFTKVYGTTPLSDCTVSGTLAYMDEAGVDISIPQPVATRPSQVRGINDWANTIRSDRIIPFGAMHPDYTKVTEEIDRLVDMGFRGIKLQPNWQEFYPDEERVFPIYEAAEGRLAILFHAGQEIGEIEVVRSTPDRLLHVHRRFQGLTMIVGHMGGYEIWNESEKHLVGTDVYFDISYCPEEALPTEEIVRLAKKHGVGKVLFASDFPFADPKIDIQRIIDMPLSVEEKECIAWRNSARILALA